MYALHSTDPQLLDAVKGPFNPVGMPAEEVLATGKPVVAYAIPILIGIRTRIFGGLWNSDLNRFARFR